MVGEKIVIVEDEAIVALSLRSHLEAARYQVTGIADSARSALSMIADTQPDLVLVDVRLKGQQTGIEVAKEIRDRWQIPVVFLTGYSDYATLDSAHDTEPYGFLLKPFETSELYSAITIALQRNQTQKQLEQLVQERTEALAFTSERLKTEMLERQRAEADALQALEKERELYELKSRFITTTSHEFRTPLSIVLTSAELLERFGEQCTEERRSRYLEKIRDAVHSMTTILTDLTTLGKAESGILACHPISMDLQQFCIQLLSDLQMATANQPFVQFSFAGQRTDVRLDPELLTLMLHHLLSNALKYSPSGSAVLLDVECLEQDGASIAEFRVCDAGLGIPPADLPRVFEPFHRATNVEMIPGTGLGLSIVYDCVTLHHGEIHLDSQLGKGTTVTVRLPIN
jgi:signal transduction histidine kinase